jgi:hypothetical protein
MARVSPYKWRAIRETIVAFFSDDGKTWTHGRAEKELAKAGLSYQKKAAAGRKGAEVRKINAGRAKYVVPHGVAEKTGATELVASSVVTPAANVAASQQNPETSHINLGYAEAVPVAVLQQSQSQSYKEENKTSSEPLENCRGGLVVASDTRPPSFGKKPPKKKPGGVAIGIDPDTLEGAVADYWNGMAEEVGLPQVRHMTVSRREKITARVAEFGGLANFAVQLIDPIPRQPFLLGRNDRKWKCDLDWVLKPENAVKVSEGKYANGHA